MKLLNGVYSAILSVTAEKVYAAKQKEYEITQVTYTPPVITDGVMVQMARFTIPCDKKETKPMKWYEDKLVKSELKII